MKAGELFVCVCCGNEKDESEASFDKALDGPVCVECETRLGFAAAVLEKEGFKRTVQASDINFKNCKRF